MVLAAWIVVILVIGYMVYVTIDSVIAYNRTEKYIMETPLRLKKLRNDFEKIKSMDNRNSKESETRNYMH